MALPNWSNSPKGTEYHEKQWGSEEWLVNNEWYCGKILRLNKGWRVSMHTHKIKRETFFILSGECCLHVDDKLFWLREGMSLDIAPGEYHSFVGIEDCEILEVSTQHFEEDSYRRDHSSQFDVDWYMDTVFPKAE